MARPSPNGKIKGEVLPVTRQVRGKRPAVIPPSGKPVGPAPRWLNPQQVRIYKELVDDIKWLDRTHRRWLLDTVMTAYRCEVLYEYFRNREKEVVAAGEDRAEAYMKDGKRHPLHLDLISVSAELRKALSALGANPAAQMKLLAQYGGVVDEKHDASAGRFLS